VKGGAFCFALGLAAFALNAHAAEVIPPKPAAYFNDYAGVVSKETAQRFNGQLAQFERDTSDQVVVAVFQKMQSDDDVAAFSQRVAQSWAVGQKDKRNGVVLFVFIADRNTSIQVGYGLEGALPDITAFDIRENHINPHFRKGDYEGGLTEGIDSILKAIRGEYTASPKAVQEPPRQRRSIAPLLFLFLFIPLSLLFGLHRTARQGVGISSKGTHWTIDWGNVLFFWLNLLLSSSSGRSSSSSSSGGGFSGGGGSFGGGGSSGSW
jgi:uncharacterized protein